MSGLKALAKLFRDDPVTTAVTLTAMGFGGVLGSMAFYGGWLG